jgi:hypothetical protein
MHVLPTACSFRRVAVAAAVIAIVALAGAPGARAAEWEWEIVPYAWAADVGVDVSLYEEDIADTTIDFTDVLDKSDFVGFLHFEGRRGRGGLFVDVAYVAMSDDKTEFGRPLIPDETELRTDLDLTIGELGGMYRVLGDGLELDVLFGVRMFDRSLNLDLDFPEGSLIGDRSRSDDETLLDGFAGLRFRQDISDRWLWSIRGDLGAGDTDLTWHGALHFGVQFGQKRNYTLYFGYKYLAYDLDEGTNGITDREVDLSGFTIGFGFGF